MDDWKSKKVILEYYWENFRDNWREIIKRRPIMTACAAMVPVILIIFVAVTLPTLKKTDKPSPVKKEWYYDLNTGKLFKSKVGQMTPIKAPSGPLADGTPAGVRAYVFIDDRTGEKVVGFLEKEKPIESEESENENGSQQPLAEKFLKKVDGAEWVSATSEEGRAIAKEYFSNSHYTKSQP